MPPTRLRIRRCVVCVKNRGHAGQLVLRKIYPVVYDPDAEAERMVRVIDETGEARLYPESYFQKLALPQTAKRALRVTP